MFSVCKQLQTNCCKVSASSSIMLLLGTSLVNGWHEDLLIPRNGEANFVEGRATPTTKSLSHHLIQPIQSTAELPCHQICRRTILPADLTPGVRLRRPIEALVSIFGLRIRRRLLGGKSEWDDKDDYAVEEYGFSSASGRSAPAETIDTNS